MLDVLASIQEQCERLGLNEEAKVIKAWVGAKLPHMLEETKLIEDFYDLYQEVSTLPPDTIPERTHILSSIDYNTAGKSVRQIMGEIGYLFHAVYKNGYLRHETHKLPNSIQQNHINFGLLIKDLVGLFGAYYNSVNKEDILKEEMGQVTEMWNTSLKRFLREFNDSLALVLDHAKAMLESSNEMRAKFLESAHDVKTQAESFFGGIQSMNIAIRNIFPASGARLSLSELEQLRNMLTHFRDFLKSLDELDSSLDLRGQEYSPQALLFWSEVFNKSSKGTSKLRPRERRQQVIEKLQGKEILEENISVEEISSEHMDAGKTEIKKARKELRNVMGVLRDLNNKIKRIIVNMDQHFLHVKEVVNILQQLEAIVQKINKEAPDLSREEKAKIAHEQYRNLKGRFKGIYTIDIAIQDVKSTFKEALDFEGTAILDFQYGATIDEYQSHATAIDNKINAWYNNLWMGDIRLEQLRPIENAALFVEKELEQISQSPLEYLQEHEKFWTDLLTFGQPLINQDEVVPGFKEAVAPFLDSEYYASQDLDEDEKVLDIAKKIGTMNSIVGSYLTGRKIFSGIKEGPLEDLADFVRKITQEVKEGYDIADVEAGEEGELNRRTFDQQADVILNMTADIQWLADVIKKPPLKTLRAEEGRVANSKKRTITANEQQYFNVTYFIEREDGTRDKKVLHLSIDTKESKLVANILETVNGQSVVVDQQTYPLPDVGDIFNMVQVHLKRENAQPDIPLNDLAKQLSKWYTRVVGDIDEEVEEEIDEDFRPSNKGPSPLRRLVLEKGLIDENTPMYSTEEKKKKKKGRGDVIRLTTIQQHIVSLPDKIGSTKGPKGYEAEIDRRATELRGYRNKLEDLGKNFFTAMRDAIEYVREKLVNSPEMLPVFPRVLYSTYNKIENASEAWNSWKVKTLKRPLSELNALLENMETREEIEERLELQKQTVLQGFPRVTIDMINQKFEQLRILASS